MPLLLSPEQELIRNVVREFADKELGPEAARVDRAAAFARDHYERMAPLGLLGLLVPSEAGGSGTDTLSYTVALEEVARASGTDAALLILQNALVAPLLYATGSPAQQERFLAPTLQGKKVGAVALTEESGGSSVEELRTIAAPEGEGYRIQGSKAFVSLAGHADFYLILARLEDKGPTLFIVERDAVGVHFSPNESKLGLRGLPLADLYLNGATVGADAVLGEPGQALTDLREPLDLARLGTAAALVGLTQRALELSVEFARGRVQFGQPIIQFGAIRGFLADVQAELEAARATVHEAGSLRDARKDYEEEVLEARLLAHRIAVEGTRTAHKVHGGAGFMRELPLERVSRDVRTLLHFWGGHDLTRARLADHVLG